MKKIFFYSLSFFALCSFFELNAQESKPIANNNPAVKEAALKAHKKSVERRKAQPVSASPVANNPIDENDIYMGRKAEFLSRLTVSELPPDFPIYKKEYGLKYYNNLVDNFYYSHKDILTPRVKHKIEKHQSPDANQQFNTK